LIWSGKVREKRVFCHWGQGKSGNVREFEKQSGKKNGNKEIKRFVIYYIDFVQIVRINHLCISVVIEEKKRKVE